MMNGALWPISSAAGMSSARRSVTRFAICSHAVKKSVVSSLEGAERPAQPLGICRVMLRPLLT